MPKHFQLTLLLAVISIGDEYLFFCLLAMKTFVLVESGTGFHSQQGTVHMITIICCPFGRVEANMTPNLEVAGSIIGSSTLWIFVS